MKNNSPIGFFDSGVGGLSVLAKFRQELPNENIIYFGDLKNLPYGNKTTSELIGFARNILDFFKTKNVKSVVIACNTSSALAYNQVKDDYNFKIYPIIQSVAKEIAGMNYSKIGVFATLGTINSHAYKTEINKFNSGIEVFEEACPNWVSIVENIFDSADSKLLINTDEDIKYHLNNMQKNNPDKIILGCTHYPYLLDKLGKYCDMNLFIDPAEIFVNFIKNDMTANNLLNDSDKNGNEEFFVSANPENFIKNSKLFYEIKNLPLVY